MNQDAMTNSEARAYFDRIIANLKAAGEADRLAKMELCREYFTNPRFRNLLQEVTFAVTYTPREG